MVLEHIPWGVVLDENVTRERLNSFSLILLPNAAILSGQEIGSLRHFVEEGGSLCLTGWSGLLGRRGEAVDHPAIEALVGARLIGRLDSRDNHVRFGSRSGAETELAPLGAGLDPDWPFLVEGPAAVFEPTTAKPIGELLRPHRTVRQRKGSEGTDWPMSAEAPVGPAMVLNKLGKGRVLTIAASPDVASAGEHPIVEARKLLANAVCFLVPRPRIRIGAPTFVEAVVTEEPSAQQLRVHFLAYSPTPNTTPPRNRPYVVPGLIEDPPSYTARIELNDPPRAVRAWGKDTKVEINGSTIEVRIQDIHEVVSISF
jgi:hypothetical protein